MPRKVFRADPTTIRHSCEGAAKWVMLAAGVAVCVALADSRRSARTLTDQLHPIGTSLRNEFFRQLLLINLSRHGLDRLGHCWSFPAKQRSACRSQLHRISQSRRLRRRFNGIVVPACSLSKRG
jgi:hypothetical protein